MSRLRLYKMRAMKHHVETKHHQRHENKVNENQASYCKALGCKTIKNNKKVVFLMSNLHTYYQLKLDFQKVDQHRGASG